MELQRVAIYGIGRFGRSLAEALVAHGLPLACVGSRRQAANGEPLPWKTGIKAFVASIEPGDLVVLALPDDAIASVASELAAAGLTDARVVHPSGVSGREILDALADAGCETGVFHVLQSFPAEGGTGRFKGSYCGIDADQSLREVLVELAEKLELMPFDLPENRAAYHAAAVLASNALVAMLDTGRAILEDAGIKPDHAGKMLLPLVKGTLSNIENSSTESALTGPIVRGDVETISSHLKTLSGPQRETYLGAMRMVLQLAERTGRTNAAKLEAMRKLLG